MQRHSEPSHRSLWNAELEPTRSQTQYLGVVSSDSSLQIDLPMEMGEYIVHRVLGRGGMGVVLEGEHKRMQRRVAIKVLAGPQSTSKRAQDQFLSEIRAVARLLHPRIVTAFDAGQFDSIVYLVMEYVEGWTWVSLLKEQGPQSVDRALHLILQAAEGLAHAHRNGVIHRDVKPGNLMVTSDGSVKLLDLGLAAFARGVIDDEGPTPSTRVICGTPEYMAPEQFEDGDLTEAVDVYALGCTLFSLLTGETPYGGSPIALLRAHCTAPVPQLADHGVDERAGLQELLDRMMAKDVDARIATMEQVIEAIREIETVTCVSFASLAIAASRPGFGSDRDLRSSQETIDMSQRAMLGVDLGGNYIAAAIGTFSQSPRPFSIGNQQFNLIPALVAPSRSRGAVFGVSAIERLRGSDQTDRAAEYLKTGQSFGWGDGRSYPPATPTAMLLHHIRRTIDLQHVAPEKLESVNLVVTVPSCFTQAMRERLAAATELCDFEGVRMIDRNIAAGLSQFDFGGYSDRPTVVPPPGHWLVVSISDISMEVSLLLADANRVQMMSVAGDLELGEAKWNRRLRKRVEQRIGQLEARESAVQRISKSELRHKTAHAIAQLATSDETEIEFRMDTRKVRLTIGAGMILGACGDVIEKLGEMLAIVLSESGVDGEDVVACLTIGPWASVSPVQNLIRNFGIAATGTPITQTQLAVAAANLGQLTRLPIRFRPRLIPCNAHELGVFWGQPDATTETNRKAAAGIDDAAVDVTGGDVTGVDVTGVDVTGIDVAAISAKIQRPSDVQLLIPRLTALPAFASQTKPLKTASHQPITVVETSSDDETRWIPVEHLDVKSRKETSCECFFEIDDQGRVRSHVTGPPSQRHVPAAMTKSETIAVRRLLDGLK